MMKFYERFLGGPVRHYDFTWMRAVAPGYGTQPHGDIVFMGRGTHNLYTAWTPLGDIDYQLGGLIILEGSHRLENVREEYLTRDVDEYCENVEGEEEYAKTNPDMHGWRWDGSVSDDPVELRERLGGDGSRRSSGPGSPHIRHLHHPRKSRQPLGEDQALLRLALPARLRASGRALDRGGARRPRSSRQTRTYLLGRRKLARSAGPLYLT
jgi:hypothetical protein